MLEAGGKAGLREEYSLEFLNLLEARGLDREKTWSLKKFAYRVLQIGKDDIDTKVKGVWKMRFRPIDEVVHDIHVRDAREFGIEEGREKGIEEGIEKGKLEAARTLLANNFPLDVIAKTLNLSPDEIRGDAK
jgi:predicted transposase/invertase (TIGR01784 family)